MLSFLRPQIFLTDAIVELQNTSDLADFLGIAGGYGIVFESNALHSNTLKIIGTLPDGWYTLPTFKAAIASAGNAQEANKFLHYITQPEALRTFAKNGLYPALRIKKQ